MSRTCCISEFTRGSWNVDVNACGPNMILRKQPRTSFKTNISFHPHILYTSIKQNAVQMPPRCYF